MDNKLKKRLLGLGEYIEEDLINTLTKIFHEKIPLPGYGGFDEIDISFKSFNIKASFSLIKLLDVITENPDANITEEVANIYIDELSMNLFNKLLNTLDFKRNLIFAKSIDSIINYIKIHDNSAILCSSDIAVNFVGKEGWTPTSYKDFYNPKEPYLYGFINECAIYINPIKILTGDDIYYIKNSILYYGITHNIIEGKQFEYDILDDDILLHINPVDIIYKIEYDTDQVKVFNIQG